MASTEFYYNEEGNMIMIEAMEAYQKVNVSGTFEAGLL